MERPAPGESPLQGYPGIVNYVPPDIPRTNMGWLIEPEALYDALRTLDREAPRLPLHITENGGAADDYVDPDGRVNDFERVAYLELRRFRDAAAPPEDERGVLFQGGEVERAFVALRQRRGWSAALSRPGDRRLRI